MPRPKCCRRVSALPICSIYKPAGVSVSDLREVSLTVDEFEALRLADYQGLYQEQASERMGISRQTFGRIIEAAHKKVAQTLVEGCALRIEGGEIEMAQIRASVRCGRGQGCQCTPRCLRSRGRCHRCCGQRQDCQRSNKETNQ